MTVTFLVLSFLCSMESCLQYFPVYSRSFKKIFLSCVLIFLCVCVYIFLGNY